jgi:hypothetical protein
VKFFKKSNDSSQHDQQNQNYRRCESFPWYKFLDILIRIYAVGSRNPCENHMNILPAAYRLLGDNLVGGPACGWSLLKGGTTLL